MTKLLTSGILALLCSCGTSSYKAPTEGAQRATIHNQIKSSFLDGKFHRVTAIDGKKVRSLNNRWPLHLAPGQHSVLLQGSYIGARVPGSPLTGNVSTRFDLKAGTEYNLVGKRVGSQSEMWLEEKNGGKRVSPVSRATLSTVPAGPPTMIFL